jgi:hypothetical protein
MGLRDRESEPAEAEAPGWRHGTALPPGTSNVERRTPNAERRTPNAERRT